MRSATRIRQISIVASKGRMLRAERGTSAIVAALKRAGVVKIADASDRQLFLLEEELERGMLMPPPPRERA